MTAPDPLDWIGREEHVRDKLGESLARRWLATFDIDLPQDRMPQGIHWCLCVPETPTGRLGPDGHPLRDGSPGSFLPPIVAPRRMWAGSRCEFLAPIRFGAEIARASRIEAVEHKQGTTGPLSFVTILHETSADGALAVRETQTLVYREAPPPDAPPAPPPLCEAHFDEGGWDRVERLVPSSALLFRYSALTFNTHRIHYDADYCREAENYRGLIVHAPLMASLLLQQAAEQFGENALTRFIFRGMSPAIAGKELVLALRRQDETIELGIFAADGRQVMKAEASLQPL